MLSFVFGAVVNMSLLVWAYFHMASYRIWVTTTLVSIVFIILGIALSFLPWMRQRAGSFALGVFVGGFFFLLPFAAATLGYAFVAMPAVIVIAVVSHLAVRFGYKLRRH
jgi:hypothetical protein